MSAALAYLVALVESGVEYPEAEYQAAKKYPVSADELRADYDRIDNERNHANEHYANS